MCQPGQPMMIDAYLDDKNFVTGLMVVYVRNSAEESALYTTPIKIEMDHFKGRRAKKKILFSHTPGCACCAYLNTTRNCVRTTTEEK